jgi:hypothetical protein
MLEEEMEQDEVTSSYVIENNSNHRGGTGKAVSIDEAIAWAKENPSHYLLANSMKMF